MTEKIVNVFLFIGDGIIQEIGAQWHDCDGDDLDKMAFLKSQAAKDALTCERHGLGDDIILVNPDGSRTRGMLSYPSFHMLANIGRHMDVLERAVFTHYPWAPQNPLMVLTCIVNGKVCIQGQGDFVDNKLVERS